jgi:hypothetical protein
MDWVGFVISVIVLIFLFFKNTIKKYDASQQAIEEEDEYEEEEFEENPLSEYLKEIERKRKIAEQKKSVTPLKVSAQPLPAYQKSSQQKKQEDLRERQLVSPLQNKRIESKTEQRHLISPLKSRHLKSSITPLETDELEESRSRAKMILEGLHHPKDMLIYHEIFGKPKGLE